MYKLTLDKSFNHLIISGLFIAAWMSIDHHFDPFQIAKNKFMH